MLNKNQTLGEFIIKNQTSFKYSSGELSSLINSIRLAAKVVNHEVNKAGLVDIIGFTGNENIQSEKQQKLDVYANEKFISTLINRNIVCGIASEEEENFITINSSDRNNQNKYVVLIDPLDGSSNIDVNVSVGTIFSIYRRKTKIGTEVSIDDFLQKGRNQVAAGYIIYGTSTMLVYTTGSGVNGFTLNPAIGTFYHSNSSIKIPKDGNIYSINEGNYLQFPEFVKKYKNPFIHGTLMVRKNAILNVGMYDENMKYAQDYKLFLELLKRNYKIKILNKKLYVLNMKNNISSLKKEEQQSFFRKIQQDNL